MKHLLGRIIFILSIIGFLYSCVYHRITHMTDEELEWATNRHEGEFMYFRSQDGVIDTVIIWEININNSLNLINWGYFNTGNKEYIATADVRYIIKHHNEGGIFHIEKKHNGKPIYFSSVLVKGWQYDVPLKITNQRIDGIMYNDVMFFYNRDLESIDKDDPNSIISYSWSKKYGLVQYTFQNGIRFTRFDIF